jgi:hypothetical protein
MMVAAWVGSGAFPSARASAYPRMEVSGVRKSCDTESRNWRSRPRERSSPAAMVLIERARPASSSSPPAGSGTRAARSPDAIRPVAAWASRSGRVNRRPRFVATAAAAARVRATSTKNPGPSTPGGVPTRRVRTTARRLSPRSAGAAAKTRSPLVPVTESPVRRRSGSRSSSVSPCGIAMGRGPHVGPRQTTAPSSRRSATCTAASPTRWTVSIRRARRSACRPSSRLAWVRASMRVTNSVPKVATSRAPVTTATMVRMRRRVTQPSR